VDADNSVNPVFVQIINNVDFIKQLADTTWGKVQSLSGFNIAGIVDTYADLQAVTPMPPDGTLYLVRADENNNGSSAIYEALGGEWVFFALFEVNLDEYVTIEQLNQAIQDAVTELVAQSDFEDHINNTEDAHGADINPTPYAIARRGPGGALPVGAPKTPRDAVRQYDLSEAQHALMAMMGTIAIYEETYIGNGAANFNRTFRMLGKPIFGFISANPTATATIWRFFRGWDAAIRQSAAPAFQAGVTWNTDTVDVALGTAVNNANVNGVVYQATFFYEKDPLAGTPTTVTVVDNWGNPVPKVTISGLLHLDDFMPVVTDQNGQAVGQTTTGVITLTSNMVDKIDTTHNISDDRGGNVTVIYESVADGVVIQITTSGDVMFSSNVASASAGLVPGGRNGAPGSRGRTNQESVAGQPGERHTSGDGGAGGRCGQVVPEFTIDNLMHFVAYSIIVGGAAGSTIAFGVTAPPGDANGGPPGGVGGIATFRSPVTGNERIGARVRSPGRGSNGTAGTTLMGIDVGGDGAGGGGGGTGFLQQGTAIWPLIDKGAPGGTTPGGADGGIGGVPGIPTSGRASEKRGAGGGGGGGGHAHRNDPNGAAGGIGIGGLVAIRLTLTRTP